MNIKKNTVVIGTYQSVSVARLVYNYLVDTYLMLRDVYSVGIVTKLDDDGDTDRHNDLSYQVSVTMGQSSISPFADKLRIEVDAYVEGYYDGKNSEVDNHPYAR